MDLLLRSFLILHICSGFTSLGLFFIPMFARKGSKLHNTVGRWYTYGMWSVIITALALCALRMLGGSYAQAMFLGFLALLTARPLYFGVAILRNKRGQSERLKWVDRTLRITVVVTGLYLAGVGMNWWGPSGGHTLLVVFGSLGFFTTIRSVIRDFRGVQKSYNWLEEHISGMLISAIAAFTAFFSFGGNRIFGDTFTGNLQIVTWVAPTVLGVAAIRYYKWKLRRKEPAQRKVSESVITKVVSVGLFVLVGGNLLTAQVYTEKQSRHRFAQLNFGAGMQSGFGGNAIFKGANGLENLDFGQSLTPQLALGGTHFWGHADFQVTFLLGSPTFQEGDREVLAIPGVERCLRFLPCQHSKSTRSKIVFYYYPIPNKGNHLFEAGINWNYAKQQRQATTCISRILMST